MNKLYFIIAVIGLNIIPFLEKHPLNLKRTSIIKDDKRTYYIIPQAELEEVKKQAPHLSIRINTDESAGGLKWGKNTTKIKSRVKELREESSMFNQILSHLESSNYPYLIENVVLQNAYGAFSSNKGEMMFQVDKMQDYFFDATIIEEFVHAYQALYYNYTHAKLRNKRKRQALKKGQHIDAGTKAGLINWKKFGNKPAFIESEAKLMTYLIQHQTCSISMEDIVATDLYNTGGKGQAILNRYFKKRNKRIRSKRLGHLQHHFVDIHTFVAYQKRFIRHWRQKDTDDYYTKGFFPHRPDALNNIYAPLTSVLPLQENNNG